MINKRKIGTEYEDVAVRYLIDRGYEILEKNYRCRFGEIDIIAKHKVGNDIFIVFIEVKYRKNGIAGSPFEAVDYKKQMIIRKVSEYFLMTNGYWDISRIRYDVVGIMGRKIELIQNAFWNGNVVVIRNK